MLSDNCHAAALTTDIPLPSPEQLREIRTAGDDSFLLVAERAPFTGRCCPI